MFGATLQGRASAHGYTDARGYGLKPTSPCAHSSFHAPGRKVGFPLPQWPAGGSDSLLGREWRLRPVLALLSVHTGHLSL